MLLSTRRRYPFLMHIWVLHYTLQYVIPRWPIHITNSWCSRCRNTPGRSVQACTGVTMFWQEYTGWTKCLISGLVQESLHSTVNTVTDLPCLHPLIAYSCCSTWLQLPIFSFSGLSHLSVISVNWALTAHLFCKWWTESQKVETNCLRAHRNSMAESWRHWRTLII